MRPLLSLMVTMLLGMHMTSIAQDSSHQFTSYISPKYFDKVSKKADDLNKSLDKKTERILNRLVKRQNKIRNKLFKIDSVSAKTIFGAVDERAKALQQKLNNPSALTQYIPFLDTIKTSLKFLNKNKALIANASGMQGKLDGSMTKINSLESQLQKAEQVKIFLNEHKQFLKDQLSRFGFAKELGKLNKDVYYYGQQINEYKETLKDPKKIERKAIDILSRTKLFHNFMQKNSMLASLFRMPSDDPNDPANFQNLAGLQTRSQVNQLIQTQISSAGTGAMDQIQASLGEAKGALQQLKDRVAKYGKSASDDDMPNFRSNDQKTKSIWKRIELGSNIQSQRNNGFLPVTSDIGLSAGYKINDDLISGVGMAYKMGWGKDIEHLKISHQGISFRSFLEYKWKKSLWVTAGYELNYQSAFRYIEQLKEYSLWKQSGLIGLSKKLPTNSKYLKNTKVQVLWNFLSYRQVPKSQAIIFRVGYSFK